MRSKRTNTKNVKFTWLRKVCAFLCSLVILVAALLIAFLDWTLDATNFENSGENSTVNAIGELAFLNLDEQRQHLISLDFDLENNVVKSTSLSSDDTWQHNLLVLNMGDRESTSSKLLMAILSFNNKNKRKVLQFVNPNIYTNITGIGNNPLGQAWLIGGAPLLFDSIEKNLAIKLNNMFILNAGELVNLIDSLNGIAIKISKDDLNNISNARDFYENILHSSEADSLSASGLNIAAYEKSGIANGMLAVAFASLSANNAENLSAKDFATQVADEFKDLTAYEKIIFIRSFMKSVTTQASKLDLLLLAKNLCSTDDALIYQQLPQTLSNYTVIAAGNNNIIDLSITDLRAQFIANLTDPA